MIKRSLALIICLIMAATLAACGEDNTKGNESSKDESYSVESISSENGTASEAFAESSAQGENGEAVTAEFFDDAVFIGDSVTLKLSYYVDKIRENIGLECLGDATFLCSGSLGYANAQWDINEEDNVHPTYQGTKYLVQDGVKAIGAKKAFIMLGMNDFALYGIDETIDNAKSLINKIITESPDITIYIQSVTPILAAAQFDGFTNDNVVALNEKLKAMCEENGWKYLDVASVLKDDSGCLPPEYCSDPDAQGIHFTDEACDIWIKYLENNVA
ncbi:MAG: hypothetical protein K6F76_01775 [Clostridiales bacterium]|nr:hypothetical protein [Clostridiales bacterium]